MPTWSGLEKGKEEGIEPLSAPVVWPSNILSSLCPNHEAPKLVLRQGELLSSLDTLHLSVDPLALSVRTSDPVPRLAFTFRGDLSKVR
jgi:hypothetical protein